MNGTEQRQHTTRLQEVQQRAEDATIVVQGLASRLLGLAEKVQGIQRDVNAIRADLEIKDRPDIAVLGKQLNIVRDDLATFKIEHAVTGRSLDALLDLIGRCEARIARFGAMNIWQRFYWLLTGR